MWQVHDFPRKRSSSPRNFNCYPIVVVLYNGLPVYTILIKTQPVAPYSLEGDLIRSPIPLVCPTALMWAVMLNRNQSPAMVLIYSIGMSNEWLLRDSSVLRLRLDNSYTDEIYYTAFNRNGGFSDPGGPDLADDCTNLNARLFWYSADDRWAVELSATNLTDEKQKGRASRRFNSSAIANSSERCGVSRSSGINLTAIGYTVPVVRLE